MDKLNRIAKSSNEIMPPLKMHLASTIRSAAKGETKPDALYFNMPLRCYATLGEIADTLRLPFLENTDNYCQKAGRLTENRA